MGILNDENYAPTEESMGLEPDTDISRPKRRRPRETPNVRSDPGQYMLDMARVGVDTITLGIPQFMGTGISGVGKGIEDYFHGLGVPGMEAHPEPFTEAFREVFAPSMDARSRLTDNDIMGAQILGSLVPGVGGANLLDDAVRAAVPVAKQVSPTAGQKAKNIATRYGATSAAGAAINTLEGYAGGQTSFEEMVANGTMGAVLAPTFQAVLGNVAMPLLRRGAQNFGIFDDFGGAVNLLRDQGLADDQFTTENILKAARQLEGDQGILDITAPSPFAGPEEASRRMHNALAELDFGKIPDKKRNFLRTMKQRELYNNTLARITDYSMEANDAARRDVLTALGNPQSRADALYNVQPRLNAARQVMDRITDQSTPNSLGSTPIDATAIIDDVRRDMIKAFNGSQEAGLGSLGDPAVLRLYDDFTNRLRLFEEEPYAHGVKLRPSEGGEDGIAKVDIFEGANLARLYNARKSFAADYLSPQSLASPSERKAAVAVIKVLDDQLADLTAGSAKISRDAFAKAMTMQDAFDAGRDLYIKRADEMIDTDTFKKAYGQSVESYMKDLDPEVREMFSAGFSQGMADRVGERGFLTEMRYLVGEYNSKPGQPSFFQRNEQGIDMLKTMLGESDANTILRVLEDGRAVADYQARLADLLNRKGASGKATNDIIGDATDGVLQLQDKRGKNRSMYDASASVLEYLLKPGDRPKARALLRLMRAKADGRPRTLFDMKRKDAYKDEALLPLLERGAKELNRLPEQVGAKATQAGATAIEGSEDIQAYLERIAEEEESE